MVWLLCTLGGLGIELGVGWLLCEEIFCVAFGKMRGWKGGEEGGRGEGVYSEKFGLE